eukprot:TRINITY_DN771_c0_g1_i11.p1 TRINITY_DN771_c0_g1~~TRINITY_DN771_c0_g1_i11.p1  ORF type:complete len:196 (+),score=56.07 TRINITY_DN771_c0_g1_i11:141-728(+)
MAEFGSLIRVSESYDNSYTGGLARSGEEGAYGLLWRSELVQVFAYVNALLRYKEVNGRIEDTGKEDLERIKNCMNNVNVAILWNEAGEKIPSALLGDIRIKTFINIVLFPVNFCRVKIITRTELASEVTKAKQYGPICEQMPVHDSCLPKMVLRSAVVADVKARRSKKCKEDDAYMSQLVKRCSAIKEIKIKLGS